MHLKFGSFILHTQINVYKTVHAGRKVLGLIVHGKVVVDFGGKLFLVDCLL